MRSSFHFARGAVRGIDCRTCCSKSETNVRSRAQARLAYIFSPCMLWHTASTTRENLLLYVTIGKNKQKSETRGGVAAHDHVLNLTRQKPSARNATLSMQQRVCLCGSETRNLFFPHLVLFRHAGAAPEAEERGAGGAVQRQHVLVGISFPAAAASAPDPACAIPAIHVVHIQR